MKQSNRLQPVILVLFFLSGACGLVYEVVWQRMLNLVLGNSTFATATILASFMGGLALGSFYFGRLADRYKKPLKLYAYLQVGIAIFALFFPFIIAKITTIYISIYRHFHTTFYFFSLLKFVLSFSVLLIPTFFMGGTLPVISKFFVKRLEKLGGGVGSLYGSNTLGGMVGCFCAGFLFIILLGVNQTTYAAAAVNILIASVALGLNRFLVAGDFANTDKPPDERENIEELNRRVYPKYVFHIILFVYALSGFCALAYEVLWSRVLVFFLFNTTYAFTIMLTTFLFGSALGSLIFAKFIDKKKDLLNLLALIEILIGLFAVLSIWEFSKLNYLVKNFMEVLGNNWYGIIAVRYIVSFLIMFIPTLLMGIAFPLVSKIYTKNLKGIGRSIGNVYSANTLGCVLGSFTAGFVVIPLIGISKGIMLIALLNLILGVVVLFCNLHMGNKSKYSLAAGISLFVGVIAIMGVVPRSIFQPLNPMEKLIYYKEGASATVAVVEKPQAIKELSINGIREVPTDYSSLRTFHMLGQLPCLLHTNPRKALVICFGAGVTSGAMAKHPLQEIDVVEICPEVIKANQYFLEENQAILADPRVKVIIEDGRNYLLRTRNQYDVITCDSTHPISSDSYILYTEQFYKLCRERLNPDGIMCQWLPLHCLRSEEYKRIIKTFQSVFPNTTLWFTNDRFSILIGAKEKSKIDFALLTHRLQDKKIKDDLEEFNLGDPFIFLSCFIMGKEALAEYAGDIQINTDNRPFVQFSKEAMAVDTRPLNLSDLSRSMESAFPFLTNLGREANDIKMKLEKYFASEKFTMRGQIFYFKGLLEEEINEYRKALAINPEDNNTKYLLELARGKLKHNYLTQGIASQRVGRLEEAIQLYYKALEIDPYFLEALHDLGIAYNDKGEYKQAEAVLRRVLNRDPQHAKTYNTLGVVYANLGRDKQAEGNFRKAISLDRNYAVPYGNLGKLYHRQGKFNEAIEELKKGIDVDPRYIEVRYLLAMFYMEKRMYNQAEIQLKKILRINPQFQPARLALRKLKRLKKENIGD